MNYKMLIVIIAIAIIIICTACGRTTDVVELEDDEVFNLYYKAREMYEWFDLKTIPYNNEKYIEVNGEKYFEVVQPGINSIKDLSHCLKEVFADDIVESMMESSSNRYIEHDGKLYVIPADRGSDIYKGAETYQWEMLSDNEIKFTVKVEVFDDPETNNIIGYESYDFFLEFLDNKRRFRNFQLVR